MIFALSKCKYCFSDGPATGLRSRLDAASSASADRKKSVRPHRPRSGALRRTSVLYRPTVENRNRQESRKRLPTLRLQSRRRHLQV